MALAILREHQEVWAELGLCREAHGGPPALHLCLLTGTKCIKIQQMHITGCGNTLMINSTKFRDSI